VKAFVTGASGFVGTHLVAHLGDEGDDVIAPGHDGDGVDVTDAAAVRERIGDERPDAVYHLAALSHVGESWSDPQRFLRVNAEGTLNVLRAAEEAGVERVLVVGSADEYGKVDPAETPLTEDAPLRPMTPYGASKVAADYLALQAFLGRGLATLRTRSFNHTGPGQSDRFVVSAFARRVVEASAGGVKELKVGSLEPVRDFSDVRDVVRAYRLLVERGTPGEAYNVSSGRGRSVHDILDRLLALAETEVEVVPDPELVRPVEVPVLVGDNSKLRRDTGWEPAYDLDATLTAVLDSWR